MNGDTSLERPLPNNLNAERSVLGAILLDNQVLNTAIEKLKTDDFFLDLHRRGELEAAGGAAYLAQLIDGVPRLSNVEHYARIVKEKAVLRSLIHTANAIQQRAFDADDEADAILDRAETDIFQLAEERIRAGLIGVKDLV